MKAGFQNLSPQTLRSLKDEELLSLTNYLRERIIHVVAKRGGHLGASLGVVELTVALHKVFDTPEDGIIFDVGHQIYAHKLITGRDEAFDTLRTYNGISGFPKREESVYDSFGTGHSSTSISAAMGMAVANCLANKNNHFVAVIGDASIVGGMAFEALNHVAETKANVIVVLNDNNMGIDPSTGSLKQYLNQIEDLDHPNFFESLGLSYTGVIDGHNLGDLITAFQEAKSNNGPQLIHIRTIKGKGLAQAEADQITYHAPGKFEPTTGERITSNEPLKYQNVFARSMVRLGEIEQRLVAVTPAMLSGSGLHLFKEVYPERTFDVGIAEQHAVTFSAGLATQGLLPVCHLYSTFLQRAYDQIIHDVALQKLPVIFAIDRAGIVGEDGPTHHGMFDIAALRAIPNFTLLAPRSPEELYQSLKTVVGQFQSGQLLGPVGIRYPRGSADIFDFTPKGNALEWGKAITIHQSNEARIALLSTGTLSAYAEELSSYAIDSYHFPFIKPLDIELLNHISKHYDAVITLEEGAIEGSWGQGIIYQLNSLGFKGDAKCMGASDRFVPQGKVDELYKHIGLDLTSVEQVLKDTLDRLV
ncbi:MAG: 1-deoxy-D-xylulose-5-phosphate synthase [Bacteroidetes bacterium]|nr:MAG: 1-deoxy-D-xylulose-5-phosphate synthase [Bacteroidota bacterium]